jgi:hypothetical protein
VNKRVSVLVARDDLGMARIVAAAALSPLEGEVLFEVERFGLSSNNVTYALLGDRLRYWDLFPAAADGWGVVPVWGYLQAVGSSHPDVEIGRRAFGLCPMSTQLVMRPDRVGLAGFRDMAAHRAALPAVYNAYFWADGDAGDRRAEDLLAVLRPVFWLSFTLDAYLADHHGSARLAVITSASSKAACGLAHQLRQRRVATVGLTSAAHAGLVEQLGLYDETLTYNQPGSRASPRLEPAVLVDIAGDPDLREHIVDRFGPFETVLVAGSTHSETNPLLLDAVGSRARAFFAPDEIRALAREWGWDVLDRRFRAALERFAGAATWLEVRTGHGLSDALEIYGRLVHGLSSPSAAHIVDLTEREPSPAEQARAGCRTSP